MISKIPVVGDANGYLTMDLWAKDINTNCQYVKSVDLVCPVEKKTNREVSGAILDNRISVHDVLSIQNSKLEELVRNADVVQVYGNFTWRQSKVARIMVRYANKYNKLSVVSISSNRAKTNVMNARGKGILRIIKSWLTFISIRNSQIWLARHSDGVLLVGEGLVPLVKRYAKNIHVGIASWISKSDICKSRDMPNTPISIIIASRLEAMKGVSIGIEAVARMDSHLACKMLIIGTGPEEESLRKLVIKLGVNKMTRFVGQLGYPDAFFGEIRRSDYVLLTNLNDEQPRLIFDVISQGAIPICPRSTAYNNLELDPKQFYEQGNSVSLTKTLHSLINMSDQERLDINAKLYKIAQTRTIDDMHIRRQKWMSSLLFAD